MRKFLSFSLFSIIAFALVVNIAIAPDSKVRILAITSPTNGTTYTTLDSVIVSGITTITGGDTDYTKYGVKVTWGDTPDVTTACIPLASDYSWTTNPSNNHIYSTTGSKTIILNLYHTCTAGSDPSVAEATAAVNLNIVTPLCDLTPTGNPAFNSMNQGTTSGNGIKTTLTNAGNRNIISLTINGADWQRTGGGATIPVGQTKWALTDLQDYDTGMTALTTGNTNLGISPFTPSSIQYVFFKLRVPTVQMAGDYTQSITFTFGC